MGQESGQRSLPSDFGLLYFGVFTIVDVIEVLFFLIFPASTITTPSLLFPVLNNVFFCVDLSSRYHHILFPNGFSALFSVTLHYATKKPAGVNRKSLETVL